MTASAASALVDALEALAKATRAVEAALAEVRSSAEAGVRDTGRQILAAIPATGAGMTLAELAALFPAGADCDVRRDGRTAREDRCRVAVRRLVARGLVETLPAPVYAPARYRRVS